MLNAMKDFCGHVENLYWTQDLIGEVFVLPLKMYHGYVVDKIEHSAGLYHLAYRVVHIVSGIFVYPLFGLPAIVGLLINFFVRQEVKLKNDTPKKNLQWVLHKPVDVDKDSVHEIFSGRIGWNYNNIYKFEIPSTVKEDMTNENKNALLEPIREKIDELTKKYRKVHVQSVGNWAKGLSIYLALYQRESPYCDNIVVQQALNDEFINKVRVVKYNADKQSAQQLLQLLTH